jgi:hypothetical protein
MHSTTAGSVWRLMTLATDQLKLAFDLGSFRCPKTGQLIEDSPREGFFANSAAIF